MTTPEQETAKEVVKRLWEISDYLVNQKEKYPPEWDFAIGYAVGLIKPLTREPQGEGFGNLIPDLQALKASVRKGEGK